MVPKERSTIKPIQECTATCTMDEICRGVQSQQYGTHMEQNYKATMKIHYGKVVSILIKVQNEKAKSLYNLVTFSFCSR